MSGTTASRSRSTRRSDALDDASAENLERLSAYAKALVSERSDELDRLVSLLDPG